MLVVVLLLAIVLFWIVRTKEWVEARREYREQHPGFYGLSLPGYNEPTAPSPLFWLWKEPGEFQVVVESPRFLEKVDYHRNHPSKEAAEARKLFPEAIIRVQEEVGQKLVVVPGSIRLDAGPDTVGRMEEFLEQPIYRVHYIWQPGEEWNWTPTETE